MGRRPGLAGRRCPRRREQAVKPCPVARTILAPSAGKEALWEPGASLAGGHRALSSGSVVVEAGPRSDGRMFLFGMSSSIHTHCMKWGPGESETFLLPGARQHSLRGEKGEWGLGPGL